MRGAGIDASVTTEVVIADVVRDQENEIGTVVSKRQGGEEQKKSKDASHAIFEVT
jgi:hypothetical protein